MTICIEALHFQKLCLTFQQDTYVTTWYFDFLLKKIGLSILGKNTDELFKVFDDFQKAESPYKGYELYSSYFNKLFIKNNTALLIRLEVNLFIKSIRNLNQICEDHI